MCVSVSSPSFNTHIADNTGDQKRLFNVSLLEGEFGKPVSAVPKGKEEGAGSTKQVKFVLTGSETLRCHMRSWQHLAGAVLRGERRWKGTGLLSKHKNNGKTVRPVFLSEHDSLRRKALLVDVTAGRQDFQHFLTQAQAKDKNPSYWKKKRGFVVTDTQLKWWLHAGKDASYDTHVQVGSHMPPFLLVVFCHAHMYCVLSSVYGKMSATEKEEFEHQVTEKTRAKLLHIKVGGTGSQVCEGCRLESYLSTHVFPNGKRAPVPATDAYSS